MRDTSVCVQDVTVSGRVVETHLTPNRCCLTPVHQNPLLHQPGEDLLSDVFG